MALQDIFDAILGFDEAKVKAFTRQEIDAGTDLEDVMNQALIAAMDEVGKQFTEGRLFVPEMLMAAHSMKGGLEIVKPLLTEGAADSKGTVIIGTVKGDLHDIGKNLVGMMLEGAGFDVLDLGVDVAPEDFVRAAGEKEARIVALSALLTTTMPAMKATINAIRESGLSVRTIVGGAPVTQAFADTIGADGYGDDGPGAVLLARRLASA